MAATGRAVRNAPHDPAGPLAPTDAAQGSAARAETNGGPAATGAHGGRGTGSAANGAGGAAMKAVGRALNLVLPGARGKNRKPGPHTRPGIAPKDGYRARGTRQRVRAIEEAVRRAIERALSPNGEVRSAARIVEETRRLLPQMAPDLPLDAVLEGIRESLDEHLRDTFRTEGGTSFDRSRRPAREGVACKLELPELLGKLEQVVAEARTVPFPTRQADVAEQLSILLHMQEEDRRPGVMDGVRRRLYARLSRALEPSEVAVMAAWIESLCGAGRPVALADRLLPPLFDQLRRAAPASTLAVLLGALERPRPHVTRTLWPHLAVEVLYGLEGAGEGPREQAVGRLADVDEDMLRSESERFTALLALGRASLSPRFLDPPRRRLGAFYHAILALREHATLASMVVAGYRRTPPPHSSARALVAITSEPNARSFLRRVLHEELDGGESDPLRRMSVGILAAALRALPREARRAEWVLEAIRSLGALRTPLAEGILEEVLSERRMLFLKGWPRACRRTAIEARGLLRLARQEEAAAEPDEEELA